VVAAVELVGVCTILATRLVVLQTAAAEAAEGGTEDPYCCQPVGKVHSNGSAKWLHLLPQPLCV